MRSAIRVLSTAPTITARISPPHFRTVDAIAENDDAKGLQEDQQIEPRRSVIDIPEVQSQLVGFLKPRIAVHLRPAGQPRRHESAPDPRSEEHTSELQSLMRLSYAVFCLKKKKQTHTT